MEQQARAAQVDTGAALGKDTFEFEGRSYVVGNLALDVEQMFEAYLKREEAIEIDWLVNQRSADGRSLLSPVTIDAMLTGLRGDLTAHRWAFDGSDAWNARHQQVGAMHLTLYRMDYHNHGPNANRVTLAWVQRLWKDRAKWEELQAKFAVIDNPNPTIGQPEEAAG